jgi:hypothetical protein
MGAEQSRWSGGEESATVGAEKGRQKEAQGTHSNTGRLLALRQPLMGHLLLSPHTEKEAKIRESLA